MSLVQIDWSPPPEKLKTFGRWMLILGGLLGLLVYTDWVGEAHPRVAVGVWIFCGLAGALALTGTRAGLPLYRAWMGLSFVLGAVVGPLVFGLFFFLVVTPIGLLMRLTGRDCLARKRSTRATYWSDAPPPQSVDRCRRQF